MKLITEIRREIRTYRADDHEVQAVCMNLATMIQIKSSDRNFTALSDNGKILGVPIHIINDIPTGEFVISSRSRKGFWIGWDRSGLWTTANSWKSNGSSTISTTAGTAVFPAGTYTPTQLITGNGTVTRLTGWTLTYDISTDPLAPVAPPKPTKAQAGLEREKKNWRHQNKRAK